MAVTVQIRKKGQFTIPARIRKILGLEENEIVTVSLLGNEAMLVTPKKLQTPKLLKETAELAKKRGLTLEEMLVELDEIRHHA